MRRKRTKSDSTTAINESLNETFEDTVNSLPDLSDINDTQQQQITKLKEQIDNLEQELNSAHQEIETLSLENNNLKQINVDLQGKNDMYKKLIQSPVKKLKNSTPSKKCLKNHKQTQTDPSIITTNKRKHDMKSTNIQKPTTVREIHQHNIQDEKTQIFLKKQDTVNVSTVGLDNTTTQKEESDDYSSIPTKRKLCIVSANKNNKVLSTSQEIFKNFQVCHYVTPNCGILRLVKDLHKKLIDYSMNDYCVVLIGEEDFLHTKNYVNIIMKLRETLMTVQNTNIILCAPTFKLSDYSTMFNWRIETFNNLLHLDLQTYYYATAFDSNLNLVYDFTMFSKFNRKINDCGMRNIFQNLLLTVTEISSTQCESFADEKFCDQENFFRV